MCVIMIADNVRPTEEMVEKGYSANPSGAGAAWRENGKVYWAKGLKLGEIQDLVVKVPLPAVFHFRIPTCGGAKDELCHPFPIQRDVPLALRGMTTGAVLFHNGHWAQWKDRVLNTLERRNKEMPPGRWSDTRAMAFYAAYFGVAALEMMDEKCVAFGPKMCEIYGSGWSKVNDIWCSNTHWDHVATGHHGGNYHQSSFRMCKERTCSKNRLGSSEYCYEHRELGTTPNITTFPDRRPKAGGTSAAERFREGTGTVPAGGDQPKGTEQVAAEVGQGDQGDKEGADPLKGQEDREGDHTKEGTALSVSRRDEDTPPWYRAFNPKRFHASSTSPILPDGDLAERRRAADKGITRVGPL